MKPAPPSFCKVRGPGEELVKQTWNIWHPAAQLCVPNFIGSFPCILGGEKSPSFSPFKELNAYSRG